ncbi:MAG: Smr/MutS family protein [Acidobacteria bacterium]|nr:Smr/MutS family protein [Acidobacteriota bacterium]
MHLAALRALEFDRVVSVLSGLAVTPTGLERLEALQPSTDAADVRAALGATSEAVRYLSDHPGFPLRAPADLDAIIAALGVDGRALEALRLVATSDYLESIDLSRVSIEKLSPAFPRLRAVADGAASFTGEIADVRRKIAPSGEVVDEASPALATLRDRLRKQRARLRSTLDGFLRGRETAKYLQEQVVTDRHGRYVLVVRAEHRSAIPGIVHGTSASGASFFLEPLETVEINNDIVALEEQEAEEVRRILLALTDAFRGRTADLAQTFEVATALDVIQARARFSLLVDGLEPGIADDDSFELHGARHPLLIPKVVARLDDGGDRVAEPVPVDILLAPPARVLVIAGPNTGGKTVALKTAGLLAAMVQAGLHIPVEKGSRLPVFRSLFADIGDEQSIAASLSTFSAHIANVVSMDRDLELPALVLLDEVGAGTDPAEGGALGIAVIDHFRRRGAHLIATTHHDALKSYASATGQVAGAAFGFNPDTFAPTYRLVYGSPGRSLAIEIAARLGMPPSVIAAAREHLSEPQKQLAGHLARLDDDLRRLEEERRAIDRQRLAIAETERKARQREQAVGEREDRLRRRLDGKVDDQLRDARREIEAVIDGLKARAAELSERAAVRLNAGGLVRSAGLSTGDLGAARSEARAALDRIADRLTEGDALDAAGAPAAAPPPVPGVVEPGARVRVGAFGLEGTVVEVHDRHADVDIRGKRLRAALRDLTVIGDAGSAARPDAASPRDPANVRDPASVRKAGSAAGGPAVRVNVNLQPREGATLGEINLIGATVDEALDRLDKFFDQATMADIGELRIVHGHGTGQLRRAVATYLQAHPLVARFEAAPDNQGGTGATVVTLKD